MQLKFKIEECC